MTASGRKSAAASLKLHDGSKVAVIGGGPAGSLFANFLLEMTESYGVDIDVTVFEPKDFGSRGPIGCNQCGGIISETLVQTLATEGINLPSSVVQRGIEAYDLHTDSGSIRINTPIDEKRIAAVHRGAGPLKAQYQVARSFDDFLLQRARKRGVDIVHAKVSDVTWTDEKPHLTTKDESLGPFDLVVVACGANAASSKLFDSASGSYGAPQTTRTAIREYELGQDEVDRRLGNSMHLYLLNIPRMKFAAVIPKGESATLCMLGKKIDRALVDNFTTSSIFRGTIGEVASAEVCKCAPKMAVSAASLPYADRLVFIGDCGASRLYKDGIGAAYRTAKAAATTAAFKGIAASDFKRYYAPACNALVRDNRYGHLIFLVTSLIQQSRLFQRAVLRMVADEQSSNATSKAMSIVLWDTFTGSAPYREIFFRTLRPRFIFSLAKYVICALIGRGLPPAAVDSIGVERKKV